MTNYLTLEVAYKEHEKIIEDTGGLPGIKDQTLESVLFHMQNDDYYPINFCHTIEEYDPNENQWRIVNSVDKILFYRKKSISCMTEN